MTFAGGYIDWCFGLAIRSYIANYFRTHATGDVRINFAADSIYTESVSPAGSEGERSFIRKRIGQYLTSPKLKDIAKAFCWVSDGKNEDCKTAAASVILSEVAGRDNDGKFYPFLGQSHYRFKIQINGDDLIQPLGDIAASRTITFNILTK